jgi:hypothetical protein
MAPAGSALDGPLKKVAGGRRIIEFLPACDKIRRVIAALDTLTADGRVVISFPEAAVPAEERESFLAMLKAEWIARQSRFTEANAATLANEVDTEWWSRNRERILRSISDA